MTAAGTDLPVLEFADKEAFATWLEREHAASAGLWLKIAKKGAPAPSCNYGEAVEVALCFGWIDGQKRGLDDYHWLQRFTPRRPRSPWSQINREKAEALIAAGAMRAAGLAEVERAQADGRWERAYAGQRTARVAPDLRAALDAQPAAAAFFDQLDAANRYAIVWRVEEAKRPETRARRIEKYVRMLAAGEKLH
jgi:uncharacterized protein YdeI (YjbR/CyaY-like superfamily)